jgi:hypothetical protein
MKINTSQWKAFYLVIHLYFSQYKITINADENKPKQEVTKHVAFENKKPEKFELNDFKLLSNKSEKVHWLDLFNEDIFVHNSINLNAFKYELEVVHET